MRATSLLTAAFALCAASVRGGPAPLLGGLLGGALSTGAGIAQCGLALATESCSAGAAQFKADSPASCCINTWIDPNNQTALGQQSGLILATQFWDGGTGYNETDIPHSTTIHGLWPDHCDGTYPAYCTNITGIPEFSGAQIAEVISTHDPALWAYMQKYYLGTPSNEAFYSHEAVKHMTCYSSLRSQCFPVPEPGLTVDESIMLNYFREIVKQFRRHPTYDWLARAGITPSTTQTYALADMQAALRDASGATPYIGCSNGAFSEVWYYNYVYGNLIGGYYKPTESTTKSSCPATGIKYLPKQ